MNITEMLIRTIEKEGIVLKDRKDVFNSLETAINAGQFEFIVKDGKNIGFFTWEFNKAAKEVFWNNMIILKQFQGKFNVLSLRKMIYQRYGSDVIFTWKNRKRNKPVRFNQQRTALCLSS